MKFPSIIAISIAVSLSLLAALSFWSAPSGTRWLGGGIHNSSDVAVYLSYLKQGADGHVLVHDLYAIEPNAARFDAVWSILGLVARADVDPVIVHEAARALFAMFLIGALWLAAKQQTISLRDSKLALLLTLGGVATGWLYSIWLGAKGLWTPTTYAAPDIVTEFAIGPILMGGAHAILSLALLVTTLRLTWNGIQERNWRFLLLGTAAGVVLLSFHPYFVPLLALVELAALMGRRAGAPRPYAEWIRERIWLVVVSGACYVPPIAYYLWLIRDPVFGEHHLQDNILPLAPWYVWILTLLPFIVAAIWMWRTKHLPKKHDWTHAWIFAAVVLLIFLPVPWKRKLTEGLAVPLVLITLPAWLAVRDWITTQQPVWMRRLLATLLLIAAWFGPIHLVVSHVVWISTPKEQAYFYQPLGLFEAARFLHNDATPMDVLLSDDRWVNTWIPALTGHTVWIGHDHETPHFAEKRDLYHAFLDETDPIEKQKLLAQIPVTYLILTTDTGRTTISPILGPEWTRVFAGGNVDVWKRN
ncbi:MAG: hypothetical protein ABIO72_04075 [Patescibacteria group bacterium]